MACLIWLDKEKDIIKNKLESIKEPGEALDLVMKSWPREIGETSVTRISLAIAIANRLPVILDKILRDVNILVKVGESSKFIGFLLDVEEAMDQTGMDIKSIFLEQLSEYYHFTQEGIKALEDLVEVD